MGQIIFVAEVENNTWYSCVTYRGQRGRQPPRAALSEECYAALLKIAMAPLFYLPHPGIRTYIG
jgi:hypothetical protein